jgi:hypothetical protein
VGIDAFVATPVESRSASCIAESQPYAIDGRKQDGVSGGLALAFFV